MKNIEPKKEYDVVVIGAGVAGLTAAALLCRAGKSVCVLEMDTRPGGYLAGFKRMNFRFDSAIHWLNQCGPKGMVTKVFDLIGTDHPRPVTQDVIKRFVGTKFNYLLTSDPDKLRDEWIAEFPNEKAGLIRFFEDAKKLGRSFDRASELFRSTETMNLFGKALAGMKRLRFALPFIKHIAYSGDAGITKGLNRYFKEKQLHEVFCTEPDVLSCLVPIAWAYYSDYQRPPHGGSQVIPEWLNYATAQMGGEVFYRTKVKEVLVENSTAKGVVVENNKTDLTIKSDYIIAACDVMALYERMLPKGSVPSSLIDKLKDAELYSSSVTVQLALDCTVGSLGFGDEMLYLAEEGLPRKVYGDGNPHTAGISVLAPSLRDPSLSPDGHGTLTIYVAGHLEYEDYWKTEIGENGKRTRGDAYKKFKKEYADILVKRVEKAFAPGLSEHILYCDIATPITHERYTGNYAGSIMGARPGKKNMQAKVAHYQTPVKNLLLGGHWAELGGGVPIAVKAATNATLLLLKKDSPELFQLLANYFDQNADLNELQESNMLKPYLANWKQSLTPAEVLREKG
ncbi:MAG: phytoene dehydrogenase-like protein [Granulosicoccus sp.]|jgi:phytoene dehydrogenase-like protein